ncbi:hypothetical protein [Actinomadura rubrisoli]|uniref:non-specific serine/threonine protein kinase n=1 Tax=Actinomadura rubrisoli TaxID=2530368 RepID=A0A4R5BUN0_9ACTN|nr:hypothetical protein [Actinomadura rubrisoli]TDD90801.1 hypothetical protein E1298_12555 [Actinomadura rubrisoli]
MDAGLRLTDRYRLVERLDGGGPLEVWRAWDDLLGRPVMVKVLTGAPPDLHIAFQRAVNAAASLAHPGLETVYDSDRTRDAAGRLASYVVTEFLDGETLAARLRRAPPPAAETADICGRIAGALEAAHAADVAHGDLNPGKVLLVGDDVKILDAGIGSVLRGARYSTAAELAVIKAADVRALGAILAACLDAGAKPESLARLVARCASADPAARPSAREVADMLARDEEPSAGAVFRTAAAGGDQTTRVLRVPPDERGRGGSARPARRRNGRGVRLAVVAVTIAIPATGAAAVLTSAPRVPFATPPSYPRPQTAPSGPSRPDPSAGRTGDAVARLRPIVRGGYAAGEVRSDVAIDLDNLLSALERDLASDRRVDVAARVAQLRGRIAARLRDRGLSRALADRLNRALATIDAAKARPKGLA